MIRVIVTIADTIYESFFGYGLLGFAFLAMWGAFSWLNKGVHMIGVLLIIVSFVSAYLGIEILDSTQHARIAAPKISTFSRLL